MLTSMFIDNHCVTAVGTKMSPRNCHFLSCWGTTVDLQFVIVRNLLVLNGLREGNEIHYHREFGKRLAH